MIHDKLDVLDAQFASAGIKHRITTLPDMDDVSCLSFDIGIGLHCCGPLTDDVIDRCISMGASICISPCCYGKIAPALTNMCTVCASDDDRLTAWKSVARGADFNPGPAHSFDPKGTAFRRAKQCMNWIDASLRAERLKTHRYDVVISSLRPLSCSPKNNLICAVPTSRLASTYSILRSTTHGRPDRTIVQSFADKVEHVRAAFVDVVPARVLRSLTIVPSPSPFYRLRCRFGVRRQHGKNEGFVHFVYERGAKVDVTTCLYASRTISKAMPHFTTTLDASSEEMTRGIEAVHYLTTLSGDLLVTMIYGGRSLDEKRWSKEATVFRETLRRALRHRRLGIVGRSKGTRIVLDRDFVEETLVLKDARILRYAVVEGAFSNPNGRVNERVLDWLCDQTIRLQLHKRRNSGLLELYCGCGNHTVALAPFFDRVVAVEIDRKLCEMAQRNLLKNGHAGRNQVVRLDSESFWTRDFRPPSKFGHFDAVLVDPPRAGLDTTTLRACANFEHILYISCKPASLKRDLLELIKTHEIISMGVFDHFKFTRHVECGCVLKRRRRRSPLSSLLAWGLITAYSAIRSGAAVNN